MWGRCSANRPGQINTISKQVQEELLPPQFRSHVCTEDNCRLCSLAFSLRYSILVAVRSHSGTVGDRVSAGAAAGGDKEVGAKERLSGSEGREGTGKGVRTGTRVVREERLERLGLREDRAVSADREPERERKPGVDCNNELK